VPRFNMHVHTWRSSCAKPEMVLESIDSEARQAGLRYVGLSDHIDIVSHNERPARNREDLSKGSWGVQFLVGCEATVISPSRLAVSDDVARELDYVMVAANHYHLESVENPVQRDPASYASHHLEMLRGVLGWGMADIVAHPFLHSKIGRIMDPLDVLECYDWDSLERLMAESREKGLSFEIKPGLLTQAPRFFREFVRLCSKIGVKFSLGSDAHRLCEIRYPPDFGEQLESMGIRSSDLIDPGQFLHSRE